MTAATSCPHPQAAPTARGVLGTALQVTSYDAWSQHCLHCAARPGVTAIDFTNTMIVTLRRHDPAFRQLTRQMDYFVPDGMPLIWCLNLQGARLKDRVYGPTFMRHFLRVAPAESTHYFLGGSPECLARLLERVQAAHPARRIVGSRHGYFTAAEEPAVVEEINRLRPDFVWVGLGTPKQQAWIDRYKHQLQRGVVLAVGFAFDVNAGTKSDAPLWMQRRGLTWVYRLASEPRRLAGRYLRHNSLFLWYLFWDGLRGRAFDGGPAAAPPRTTG